MRRRARAAIASGLALFAACKSSPPPHAEDAVDAGALAVTSAGTAPDAGIAAPRCKVVDGEGARATLGEVGDRRSLVVGEGVATADGMVVGIVHTSAAGPEALVAHVAGREVKEWVVAKSVELVPDAPPPKPLVAAGALYAAYVARGSSAQGAPAGLHQILLKKSGVAAPIATYAEHGDDSLALDAALSADGSRAALVWDEDVATGASGTNGTNGTRGGGITLGVVPLAGGQPLAPRVVSGDAADPDGPRVAPRAAGGWWVAWTAHRAEAIADASARAAATAQVEAPAEDRVYSWIEVVAVGGDGAPVAPPRRISPALGHAASFDLAPRPRGGLDVVVRDETQLREGEGGRITHVVVLPDGTAEEPQVLVQAGAGRGSVDLVTGLGDGAWLTFSDAQDRALVVPLGPGRAAAGVPSVEDALEGGRLLTVAVGAAQARFMAAFPAVEGALFREVACAP